MTLFEKYFCNRAADDAEVLEAFIKAKEASGNYAEALIQAVERGDGAAVLPFAKHRLNKGDHESVEPILRYFGQRHPDDKDLAAAWSWYNDKAGSRENRAA